MIIHPILGHTLSEQWKINLTFKNLDRVNFLTPIINNNVYLQKILLKMPFIFNLSKKEFFIADYFILGDNIFLNMLIIKKIIEKAQKEKRKFTIAFLNSNYFDYWGYHILKKNDDISLIDNEFNFFDNEFIDIVNIYSDIDFSYVKKFDNEFCVFLSKNQKQQHFIEKTMPTVSLLIDNLKHSILYSINQKLKKLNNYFSLRFNQNLGFSHIICKNIFFTSLTPNINFETHMIDLSHNSETISTMQFKHDFTDYSFGSAFHIPNEFTYLDNLAYFDIDKLHHLSLD